MAIYYYPKYRIRGVERYGVSSRMPGINKEQANKTKNS